MPAPPPEHRRGAGLAAFQHLERHARRLELSIFLLVGLVAVAPPTFYAVFELRAMRTHARDHADHVALMTELYGFMPARTAEGLARHLQGELERDKVQSIQVFAMDGTEALHLGEGVPRPPYAVEIPLGPRALPFARVRLQMPDAPFRAALARLIVVHMLVGVVLAFGVYRIPVRAFARAIRELKSAQSQLVHSNRLSALGAMYAGLGHEINNPLGIVSARAKLATAFARERGYDEELVHDLEVIDRQAARIAEIMRSLLAFARRTEFVMAEVDLNGVAREVVGLVEKPFGKQGIAVRTSLDPALPRVRASADHLQQVLLNLVTNARDAVGANGTIVMSTGVRNGFVTAEVADTGPGLAPEVLARLFEPFFTTKDVGKGTGLGLSVSWGIVSAHGGDIEAANAPGGGAVFRVRLPAAA